MIIFLYGPDAYRRNKKLKELVAEYQKRHLGITIQSFDMEEDDAAYDRCTDFVKSQSLFEAYKLAVIKNLYAHTPRKPLVNFLREYAATPKITLIVSEEEKPPKELAFLLSKPVLVQEFAMLSRDALKKFIQREAQEKGVALPAALERRLQEIGQSDTWAIASFLDQVRVLEHIDEDMGRALLPAIMPEKMFSVVTDFKRSPSYRNRIVALERLIAQNESPAHIFNLLASLADGPLVEVLADQDVAIKSGEMDYDEALLALALA